jgi:putative holliday junction resolvase
MGRILAIDYGNKRCGIAVSDPLRIIASALDTIPTHLIFQFLAKYMLEEKVDSFVVGLPLQMNGQPSESTKYIEPFVRKLGITYPEIPIHRVDERYTTVMAHQTILASGISKKSRQDKTSATIILQSYMQGL